jgi:hypothetical protein
LTQPLHKNEYQESSLGGKGAEYLEILEA